MPRTLFDLVELVRLAAGGSIAGAAFSDPGPEWPMWGGTPDRNMISSMKGLPTEWDVKTKKNIKWVAGLGSQSYGNPVVAGGMVFVGTNNELLRDPKQPGRCCAAQSPVQAPGLRCPAHRRGH